jgi:arylsulfatase
LSPGNAIAQPVETKKWLHYPARRAPRAGAPNILIIMTDDVGFGASSAMGGPIPTPTFDRLARSGLLYNQFHTTAMCSPTRAALLTGRNHHAVGSGIISDMSVDQPGYTSVIPDTAATIGKVLGDNGYNTAWLGKNHNTPTWEYTADGPFNRWPNAMGFEYFYGFNGGGTNQFAPELIENRNLIDPPKQKDYILDRDLADHAVSWLRRQKVSAPNRPFLLYYAPGTAHVPIHAPADWIARFKGRFSDGWDVQRERTFAKQKVLGVIPANAELTPRPPQIPAWDSLTPAQKKIAARQMEAYAAALSYCDSQIGRVVDELERSGQIDNTLIFFLQGDNGAAAENLSGAFDQYAAFSGVNEEAHALRHLDAIGGPASYPAYPIGWAWSMDTPFQWSKMVASHFGGMRNALAVYWPKGIHAHGLRTQFHHVIDIAPTIYQVTGVTPPKTVNGVPQMPIDGVSMAYSFDHAAAPTTHRSQYFELLGNRSYYQDGWIASTTPKRMPWEGDMLPGEDGTPYRWELYHVDTDYSQAHNLASQFPDKLKKLQAAFNEAAKRNHVLPIQDSFLPRFDPAFRPASLDGQTSFTYYPSTGRIPPDSFPALGRRWRAAANIAISNAANGPILSTGDKFAGWSIYLRQGVPTVAYRATDEDQDRIVFGGQQPLGAGDHVIVLEGTAPSAGQPGSLLLQADGKTIASQPISRAVRTKAASYVGRAPNAPLIEDDSVPDRFDGTIHDVTVTVLPNK